MRIGWITFYIGLLLITGTAIAHGNDFEEAKQLIDSGMDCSKLADEQLESIGEYYMEQMHPGEAHDLMHEMMGIEEGTLAHKQFHINLARAIYCKEGGMMGGMGMMNMMQGMMGNWYGSELNTLNLILIIGLIVLVYLFIFKTWRELSKKKK